eukprot:TRINITY_DN7230_c2_g3_i1.p1 TRINITY_DN7230_c2_g3~~TRINITY_DN7230_c2_g3_i1.p1  ORF type:complete len:300 (+),score=122.13 TRINITY_DN7230_c2_g3_i1:351-1250(+)
MSAQAQTQEQALAQQQAQQGQETQQREATEMAGILGQICPKFVEGMSRVLEQFVAEGNTVDCPVNIFSGVVSDRTLSVEKYVQRLSKYCALQEEDLITALILIDRVAADPMNNIWLCSTTFHRMFLIALTTSLKSRQDLFFSNPWYAKCGGVSLECFNKMEMGFIRMLDFNTFIEEDTYKEYCQQLSYASDFGPAMDKYLTPEEGLWVDTQAQDVTTPMSVSTAETEYMWQAAQSQPNTPSNMGSRKGSAHSYVSAHGSNTYHQQQHQQHVSYNYADSQKGYMNQRRKQDYWYSTGLSY